MWADQSHSKLCMWRFLPSGVCRVFSCHAALAHPGRTFCVHNDASFLFQHVIMNSSRNRPCAHREARTRDPCVGPEGGGKQGRQNGWLPRTDADPRQNTCCKLSTSKTETTLHPPKRKSKTKKRMSHPLARGMLLVSAPPILLHSLSTPPTPPQNASLKSGKEEHACTPVHRARPPFIICTLNTGKNRGLARGFWHLLSLSHCFCPATPPSSTQRRVHQTRVRCLLFQIGSQECSFCRPAFACGTHAATCARTELQSGDTASFSGKLPPSAPLTQSMVIRRRSRSRSRSFPAPRCMPAYTWLVEPVAMPTHSTGKDAAAPTTSSSNNESTCALPAALPLVCTWCL